MKSYKKILSFFSFILSCINCFSQPNALIFQPVNNAVLQQYNIRHITTGADGKLWLSTDKGLLCYDGNDVKAFKHDDNDVYSISSDNIFKTYPDAKGNLYVMNDLHEYNLSFMDGKTGKFTVLDVQHNIEDFRLMATPLAYADLLIDDDGSLWIGGYYIGLAHYNPVTKGTDSYFFHHQYSGKNTVYTIKKDINNKELLWLGTQDGIYSFNKKTKQFRRNYTCRHPADSSAADLLVTNIDVYSRDTLWFTVSGKGIGCYDIKTGYYNIYPVTSQQLAGENADLGDIQIERKSKNEYFVATKYTLPGVFNSYTKGYQFTAITSPLLPAVQLNTFLRDSTGNLWCLLYNRLFKAPSINNKFETIRINNTANETFDNPFKTIVWDEKRKLYYAAFEKSKGVFVLDANLQLTKTLPVIGSANRNDETRIYDLALDNNGKLWVCGNLLYAYDEKHERIVPSNVLHPHLSFPAQRFQNLVMRGENIFLQPSNFWCRAIYHINANTLTLDSIVLPDEIAKDKNYEPQPVKLLNYLAVDKAGNNAYMGYSKYSAMGYEDCLLQLNIKTKKVKRVTRIKWVAHNETSNLFNYALDDNDRIWIETEEGIRVYEPNNCKLMNTINSGATTFSTQLQNIAGAGVMCRLYTEGVRLYNYKNGNEINLSLHDGLSSYTNSAIAYANNNLFVGASNYIQYIPLAPLTGKQNTARNCYLTDLQIFNHSYTTDTLPQYLHHLSLPYNKNFISFSFSCNEFEQPERLEYRYKLDGVDKDWVYVNYLNRTISYNDLTPGHYTFHAMVKNPDGKWSSNKASLSVNIIPAWWQTNLFKILLALSMITGVYLFVRWRISSIRHQEHLKGKYEKELLELEAKALRAQMNPHFIFNCMNSIKALIQKGEQEKAILYLTTFSKLIRTVFQNSDKREITLHDEIETCRLYTQLESMRFGNKFNYAFCINPSLDLKSVMIPALIIQPFIENAIWHGIMPKEENGTVTVSIDKSDHTVRCTIDDNGIGRAVSKQNKFLTGDASHQSKGEHLTQARLDLDNLLNERDASIRIIDKEDESEKACGTTVIISFQEY